MKGVIFRLKFVSHKYDMVKETRRKNEKTGVNFSL